MTPEMYHSLYWPGEKLYDPSGHVPLAPDHAHRFIANLHPRKGIQLGTQRLIQTLKELYWTANNTQLAQKVERECRPCALGKDIYCIRSTYKMHLTFGHQYREYRNQVNKLLKNAKINYFQKKFVNSQGDSKKKLSKQGTKLSVNRKTNLKFTIYL